jgi:hypothetical protein
VTESCASKFGWSEIPFEPLGVDTGKYPIVRAEDFDELQRAANIARKEKKFDIKLLRAPQGAGKTALSSEIRNTFLKDKEVFVIFHQLINMKPADMAQQIVTQAMQNHLITNNFDYDKDSSHTNSELKDFVVRIFEEAISKNNFGLWVVDEFDTISSSEASEGEKSEFLQWLRSVIDGIANSKKIHGKGFLLIMAHTEKSAEEFGKELKNLHGPLQERLMSTGTIEIGYKLHEVKNIVSSRINSVKSNNGKTVLEPFTDDAISTLYDKVNYQTGTREMISFRLFEKTCYKSIVNACEKNEKIIGVKEIEQAFQEIQKTLFKENLTSNLSAETMLDISKIIRADESAHNVTILNGLGAGISNFMTSVLEDMQILGSKSLDISESGIQINEIRFLTELKLKKSQISSIWYCVSKKKESFSKEDFDFIEKKLTSLEDERLGMNLTILCLVTDKEDVPLDEEFVKSHIKSMDELFLIDKRLERDLISLGCCKKHEIPELQRPFDQHIRSKFTDLLSSQVRDITFSPSEGVQMLIKILNLLNAIGEDLTAPHLQAETGRFYSRSKPVTKAVKEMIQLGFATESSGNLIPEIPKSLENVLELIKSNNNSALEKVPNKDVIIETATELELLDEDNNIIKIDKVIEESQDSIENVKTILQNASSDDSKILNELRKLLKCYEQINSVVNLTRRLLLIQFIQKEIKLRLKELQKNELRSNKQESTKEKTNTSTSTIVTGQSTSTNSDEQTRSHSDTQDKIMDDIESVLSSTSMTLPELAKQLQKRNYPPDIRQKLFFLVKSGKIKLTI